MYAVVDVLTANRSKTVKKPTAAAFTRDGTHVFVADKFGDVTVAAMDNGDAAPLLGHYCRCRQPTVLLSILNRLILRTGLLRVKLRQTSTLHLSLLDITIGLLVSAPIKERHRATAFRPIQVLNQLQFGRGSGNSSV